MKKTVVGILVGTIVYFGWGMISWMALPWHENTMKKLPEEQLIMDTLKTVVTEPGFYFFPCGKTPEGRMDQKVRAEKFKKGPTGVVIFSPGGKEPMPPSVFLIGLLGDFLVACIGMLILNLTRDRVRGIVPRAFLMTTAGIVVGLTTHIPYWNWFGFPSDFTRVAVLDNVVAFTLLGFAQAKFVLES